MPRRFVLIIVALLLSGGTFFLAQQWLHGRLNGPGPSGATGGAGPARPVVRVLVAKADLPAGSLLTAESLRWQAWPADDPPTAFLTEGQAKPQDFIGAVARARLTAGEPVTPGALVHPGERGFMAAVLTPGTRGITINVTPNGGMAGFVAPGDRVDLILTMTLQPKDKDASTRHVSETVLSDLRVVGVDQSLSDAKSDAKKGDKDKKDPVVAKTTTLEVTPKQAEIVSVAADLGLLTLSLRSLGRPGWAVGAAGPTHTWDSEAAKGVLGGPPGDRTRRPPAPPRRLMVVRGDAVTEMVMAPQALKGAVIP